MKIIVYSIVVLFALSCQFKMKKHPEIFKEYLAAINAHELDSINKFLSDNHIFINPQNKRSEGKESMINEWKELFEIFPDYQLSVTELHEIADGVVAIGTTLASAGEKKTIENSFAIPFAIKCSILDEKIVAWQMIADTKISSAVMDRVSALSDDERTKVQGFGGVFFKAKDPKALAAWYDAHLGTHFENNLYQTFKWRERSKPGVIGRTEFSLFSEKSDYYDPSKSKFMLNFRVNDLDALMDTLSKNGVEVVGKIETFEYGKFAWILDAEGNKIELWQPVDDVLEAYEEGQAK